MRTSSTLFAVLFAVLALNGHVMAGTCGGNCPGGRCTTCPCGTSKNIVNAGSYCNQGSWSQTCCKCITSRESGANANALNYNTNKSFDVGLFQINDFNWGSCSGGRAPCNPSTNLSCAKKVYAWGGNTWKNWSTCGGCGCCSKAMDQMYRQYELKLMMMGFNINNMDHKQIRLLMQMFVMY